MDLTPKREVEYRNILEALSKSVDGARVPYNDNLDHERRKAQLDDADHSINLLSNAFGEVMLKLKRDRNLYVPINRLVDELLIEIWTYTDLRDRFSISRVSSRWRQVALSATSLWTLIDLEYNHAPTLRNLLQRSGSSPLHMVVSVKKHPNRAAGLFGTPVNPHSFSFYNHRTLNLYDDYSMVPPFGHTGPTPKLVPFLTQKEFDSVVARCATLDAFVGENKRFYVTPKTLTTPMPYLKTLRLMGEGTAGSPPNPFGPHSTFPVVSIPFPIFGKVTPQLRELYFDNIHAQWGDPIYKDLTRLRMVYPKQRATVSQILRVLELCPKMVNLELKECLQSGISLMSDETSEFDSGRVIALPRMSHLHIEDSHSTPVVDLLTSLSLPPLNHFYLGVPGNKCLTDKYGRPIKSLLPTIEQTTDLMIGGYYRDYLLQAMNRNITSHDAGSWNTPGARWYYATRDAMTGRPYQFLQPPINFAGNTASFTVPFAQATQANANPAPDTTVTNWSATASAIGVPPTVGPGVGIQPPHPAIMSGDNTNEFIDVLEQVSLGGVQFHGIERLDFSDGVYFMDTVYRDIFSRCEGIQKLKFSYNKGIGILNAIIKQKYCPMLAEVYLCGVESFPGAPSIQVALSPTLLADWIESRREASNCRRLTKVVVQFFDSDDITLDSETRKRIEDGLGKEGTFIWRSAWSSVASMRRQWTKLIEEGEESSQKPSTDDEKEMVVIPEDGEKDEPAYPFESEWPLYLSGPLGWNDGPW